MSRYYIEKRVNKKTDKTEWLMTPQTINAYYNPTTNEICFPAGILQPPFFNAEADDACNYGAIGVVIGHEMTHGFDDQGSQFDKEGNLRNWWTKADGENFKARTKVMADFFNKIEVLPGLHANGELTLGENIADHGGLNIAFQAFQNATKENPLGTKDGFTPEQRFFLSYALVWGGNIREAMLRQLNKLTHTPQDAGVSTVRCRISMLGIRHSTSRRKTPCSFRKQARRHLVNKTNLKPLHCCSPAPTQEH